MKKYLLYIYILMASLACAQQPAERPYILNPDFDKKISKTIRFSVPTIGPREVQAIDEPIYYLDAREAAEYAVSHIPNARCIGYEDFDSASVRDIPKDAIVVVYCSIGYRSEKIGEQLQKDGFSKVYNLYGSIFEWANQGFPLATGDTTPTRQVHTYNKAWSKWVDGAVVEKIW